MGKLNGLTFFGVSAHGLSSDLWSFLLRWLGPKLYPRRTRISLDVEGNGFELWRKLFSEYEGSDELINMAGRTKLQDFPQIKHMRNLHASLDEWIDLFYRYGQEIGPNMAQTMFLRILPDELRTDIHRRPELKQLELLELID